MSTKKEILLETGTGEAEVLEFRVGEGDYAINVIKIKEILEVDNISPVPKANASVIGLTMVRGAIIPLVDMKFVLTGEHTNKTRFTTLLCEFNQNQVAFCVDFVKGIQRVPWKNIQKPDAIIDDKGSLVIGNITFDNRIVMMLDFEKVVSDIAPATGINEERIEKIIKKDRSNLKVVLSDDSPLIRKVLFEALTKAGFSQLRFFNDGQQAWNYFEDLLERKGENFKDEVDILITDIEMPQMDGHTLTRKIKENPVLKTLPVVIFSSLITETLKHKGESVNADAQLSKPEIENLVDVVDKLVG
ncbi:chemotaxis protein [Peptoanaerobacter stomatis]|uniref:chemotaxis protein n=1 Tax=Peptoanaerobacter stomatis TaxID=796937 RepID=UPI003FA0EFC3